MFGRREDKSDVLSKLSPLGNRVLVVVLERPAPDGLVAIDSRRPVVEAQVLAVGPGRKLSSGGRFEMPVVVGDHILFDRYAGADVLLCWLTDDVRLLPVENVLAVVVDSDR